MLHARHVARGRAIQVTAGKVFGVERRELPTAQQLRRQLPGFRVSALAPVNRARLRQLAHRVHPSGHVAAELRKRGQCMCGRSHP